MAEIKTTQQGKTALGPDDASSLDGADLGAHVAACKNGLLAQPACIEGEWK